MGGYKNQEIGWSTESKLLQYILKQLDRLLKLISSAPSSSLTADEMDAISGANAPDGTNVFATINDIPGAVSIASGSDINTGTDNAKMVTSKAITDSNVAFIADVPVKAAGSDITTGTNDDKFVTAKALADASNVLKFKNVYTAFISQASTNAPTEDIKLHDDLSTPVWSYSAVGTYLLTKASAFTSTKTVPNAVVAYYDNAGNKITLERTSANVMTLKTYAAADTAVLANGVITGQLINIEVYI